MLDLSNCPLGDPDIVDFVGYGTSADCAETANAPAPSNTTSIFRINNGAADTENNSADFVAAAPNPRRTAPIVEIGPAVFSSDPRNNGSNAPRDANITINFTEPVDVMEPWFNIKTRMVPRGFGTATPLQTVILERPSEEWPIITSSVPVRCSTTVGTGPRSNIDVPVKRTGGNPWTPFGTWSITY